jgi:FKBP-type peptidyl-prolyl cis-trans isomerase FkpA
MFSTRRTVLALVVATCVAGCGELADPDLVPVVLPGSKVMPVIPEGEAAEALGEAIGRGGTQIPGQQLDVTLPKLPETEPGETRTGSSGLQWTTLTKGQGPEIGPGQRARVHYVGTLTNGTKFDSSRDRGEPFQFVVGKDAVIRGWHQGVSGMKVGEVRRLTIPPELGYGVRGQPPVIPPNATLIFEIELLGIEEG